MSSPLSPQSPASQAAKPEHLPLMKRVAYGVGALGDFFIFALINVMIQPFYVLGMHLDPRWLGYAVALPRLVGVVTDPMVGSLSDHAQTRWGRRRPFFVTGAVACACLLPLVWLPPVRFGPTGMIVYLVAILTLFQAVYSLYIIPFGALGYELTSDPDERTRVLAWCPYLTTIGTFAAPWFYWIALLPALGGSEVPGVRWMSLGCAVAIVVCGVIPALAFREKARKPLPAAAEGGAKEGKVRVWAALRETLRSKAFVLLLGAMVLVTLGVNCQGVIQLYIAIFHIYGGDKLHATELFGIAGTVVSLSTFVILPLVTRLSAHYGKRKALMGTAAMCAVGGLLTWWTFSPRWPYLMILSHVISYGGMTSCNLLIASMTADVCDEDELHTGLRREGAFAATSGATLKVTLAVMTIAGGYLPALAGYTQVAVPPSVGQLTGMRLLYAAIQVALCLGAVALVRLYPITKERDAQIRLLLNERRKI